MRQRREPPAGQRMKIVGADSPELVPTPEQEEGGGYWGFIGWWFGLLLRAAALLGLVAGFFGLWLAAAAVWHWMGL